MKKNIHPIYSDIDVSCNCGNRFIIKSIYLSKILSLEVCNECHPFYTGKQKIIDAAGRVDSFYKRFGKGKK